MADPKRMEAAFIWVSEFYGPVIDLPPVNKPQDFWKEHILSLATLCKTKIARRFTADSAEHAYEDTKKILRYLDQQGSQMNRWEELDATAAAKGDEKAIYKFIVLLLHNLCNFVDDYITESQEFVVSKGIEKPFVDLLSDVNNAGTHWWQGNGSSSVEVPESPVISSPVEKDGSFGKYSMMEIPSTPRTPFQRRPTVPLAPLSPIQKAVNSPVTVKIRQEEYKRMRNRIVEIEHMLDLEREDFASLTKEAKQYKDTAKDWREKFEASEGMCKQLNIERQDLKEELDKAKINMEKLIGELRDYKRRVEKEVAEIEQLRRDRANITEERDRYALAKTELEQKMTDLIDEHQVLKENKIAVDNLLVTSTKQNERYVEALGDKEAEICRLREENRLALSKKEEECGDIIVREADLRLQLQNSLRLAEELRTQIHELEESTAELQHTLSAKDMELNEMKDSSIRQIAACREANSRQLEQLQENCRKLQSLNEQANDMLLEKEGAIQELREKLIDDLDGAGRFTAEKTRILLELQDAKKQLHESRIQHVKQETQLQSVLMENLELKEKLDQKSRAIQENLERIVSLEKQIEPIRTMINESRPVIRVKEEPQHLEKSIKVEEIDDFVEVNDEAENKDLSHLDWNESEESQFVMHSKSILGNESKIVIAPKKPDFSQDVDKTRVEELKRRNKAVPPALRSSYAVEFANYESPSAEEVNMKAASTPSFRVPHTPQVSARNPRSSRDVSPTPSGFSNQSCEDKENTSFFINKPPLPSMSSRSSKKSKRRVSLGGIFNGFKKN